MSASTQTAARPPVEQKVSQRAGEPRRRRSWRASGSAGTGIAFLTPAIALVLLVSAYPIYLTVSYSFRESSYFDVGGFIGLQNYVDVLTGPQFGAIIRATVLYCLGSLALMLVIALPLALALNNDDRFTRVLRPIVLMPWVISQTVTALLWVWLLTPDYGPLSSLAAQITGEATPFLANPQLALVSVVVANAWMNYPIASVLILAALKAIPGELYEAAFVDGAARGQRFRYITLPGIRNVLGIVCIMQTVLFVNMVTLIYTMTGGGPLSATETLSVRIFHEAFDYNSLGTASVYAVIAVILNLVFAAAYLKGMSRAD